MTEHTVGGPNLAHTQVQGIFSESCREAKPGERERSNTLHVYGLDILSTADLRRYFQTPDALVQIEWLNDSACNIQYPSDEAALSAVHRLKAGSVGEGGWYAVMPIVKKGVAVSLKFRFATEQDTKTNMKTKDSKFLCRVSKKKMKEVVVHDDLMVLDPVPVHRNDNRKRIRKNRKRARCKKRNALNKRVDAIADSMGAVLGLSGKSADLMNGD